MMYRITYGIHSDIANSVIQYTRRYSTKLGAFLKAVRVMRKGSDQVLITKEYYNS